MYSLVSAAVLAADLARHPSGTAVAHVADRVLVLTRAELLALATHAEDRTAARQRVLESCAPGRLNDVLDRVREAVSGGRTEGRTEPPTATGALVRALSETLMGALPDLLALLRREQPLTGADPAAVAAALDAVTAAWAGRSADLRDLAALRRPWDAALDPVSPALPEAVWTSELRRLLDDVDRRTAGQWAATAAEHATHRGSLRWSAAMHQASRAAHDGNRLPEVARAQLAGARALRLSGASAGPDAHAVAMAVTAAVQAVCTGDLLTPVTSAALLSAWRAGAP